MKYANIKFDGNRKSSVNIGDDMQLIAIENLYHEMGIDYKDVIRIGLSELATYNGEYVVLPISFPLYGYRENLNITMFSPKIIPVFLGLSIMSNNLSESEITYLRRFEPIGCRDYYTMELLREKNIMSYMGGCLTATLPRRENKIGSKVYMVDVPKSYYEYIPDELKYNAVVTSQIYDECEKSEETAKKVLSEYRENARLIITTRLHGALPCIAMGIPVVLMKDEFSFRFTTLSKYIQVYTKDRFKFIDWNPSYIDYEEQKKIIIESAQERIMNAYEKYNKIASVSDFYETSLKPDRVYVEHFDNVLDEITELFSVEDEINYAIWGITQKADMICTYMENNYKKSKLVAVYDRDKRVVFHGVQSTQNIEEICDMAIYVFVTAATANSFAQEKFKKLGKKNYHISTDGIEK